MATAISRSRIRPAKDEWGVYDPQQAGLAALYARLDAKDPKAAAAPAPALTERLGVRILTDFVLPFELLGLLLLIALLASSYFARPEA